MAERIMDDPDFISSNERWQRIGAYMNLWQAVADQVGLQPLDVRPFVALPRWPIVAAGQTAGNDQPVIDVRYYHRPFGLIDTMAIDALDERLGLNGTQLAQVHAWASATEPLA